MPGDLAGGDLERGEQGDGAVPNVVVGAPLGQTGLHRQDRGGAVQRLNLGLLVDAEHDRVLRRCQVQPDDVGDLRDQLRVGGELEGLAAPRLDAVVAPGPRHRGVGDPQPVGQQSRRPVRHPELLRRRLQCRGHNRAVIDRARPAGAGSVVQPGQAANGVPPPPQRHGRQTHPDQPRDLHIRRSVRGQQHNPTPLRQPRPHRRRPQQGRQLLPVTLTQSQQRCSHHS
jgi:hypothetical protein